MLVKPASYGRKKLFYPDYIVSSILEINFNYLKSMGIRAVLIDLDGTVVNPGTFLVNKDITNYLKKQKIDIYIATNRPKSRNLKNLKASLHAIDVIHPVGIFMKPFPQYFKQVMSLHQLNNTEVAMVGDRYLQDIFGANLAGYTTILVQKLGDSEGIFDTLLSNLEQKRTNRLIAKYEIL